MPAGALIFPQKAKLNILKLGMLGNLVNLKLALMSSAWSPNNGTLEVYADLTNQISGNGYPAGGIVAPNVSVSQTSGVFKYTADPLEATANGGSISAWRRGCYYIDATIGGVVKPVIGHFLGDASDIDVPATVDTNILRISPASDGIVKA